jgi:hypothetical protein
MLARRTRTATPRQVQFQVEYARLNGKNRRFIKGQKYNLLLRPQGGIRPALGLVAEARRRR